MAGTETRMLLLGAVSIFGPVNGYQIRRELGSWGVETWAHLRPGSVYHGLWSLTQRGDLEQHELDDGGREVAVYEITPQGREELERLIAQAITTVHPLDRLAFSTAMTMVTLLPRERLLDLLRQRRTTLLEDDDLRAQKSTALLQQQMPPHVLALMDLWGGLVGAERAWLESLIDTIERGGLAFAGEREGWTTPDDDPGWAMQRDRERYLRLLGR